MNKEQRIRATIDAMNWLNLAGWDDAKISKALYKGTGRADYIQRLRNGSVMRDRVFRRLMLLVQDVNVSQIATITTTETTPTRWQRFTAWIRSLLS